MGRINPTLNAYRNRRDGNTSRRPCETERDRDDFSWLLCTNKTQHDLDRLMLVQIIPGDILEETSAALDDYARKHLDGGGLKTEDSKVKMTEIISKTVEATMDNGNRQRESPVALRHFVRSPEDGFDFGSEMEPVKSFVVEETRLLYPGAKHTFLCDGKVNFTSISYCSQWSNLTQLRREN